MLGFMQDIFHNQSCSKTQESHILVFDEQKKNIYIIKESLKQIYSHLPIAER